MKTNVKNLIAKLNRLYKALPSFSFISEDDDAKACQSYLEESRKVGGEFDKVMRQITASGNLLKFDYRGEYFPKLDDDGEELYTMKVEVKQTYFVRLPARNVDLAVLKAKEAYAKGELTLDSNDVEVLPWCSDR